MCVEHDSLCDCVWWYSGTGSDSNWTKNQSSRLDWRSSKQIRKQVSVELGTAHRDSRAKREKGRVGAEKDFKEPQPWIFVEGDATTLGLLQEPQATGDVKPR
jgi:hypothetical protein